MNTVLQRQDASRSSMALIHRVNVVRALRAASRYFSRSAGVTRMFRRTDAGSAILGRPRGRFGCCSSMVDIVASQIIVDKPFLG